MTFINASISDSTAPYKDVRRIQFGILGPEEIVCISFRSSFYIIKIQLIRRMLFCLLLCSIRFDSSFCLASHVRDERWHQVCRNDWSWQAKSGWSHGSSTRSAWSIVKMSDMFGKYNRMSWPFWSSWTSQACFSRRLSHTNSKSASLRLLLLFQTSCRSGKYIWFENGTLLSIKQNRESFLTTGHLLMFPF